MIGIIMAGAQRMLNWVEETDFDKPIREIRLEAEDAFRSHLPPVEYSAGGWADS